MKKYILSAGVVIIFVLYAIRLRFGDGDEARKVVVNISPSPIPTNSKSVKYKDGTYTGNVADAFYGNIQVQAVIKNGKITDVVFLQYPNDRGTSIEINTQAMPVLKTEAIAIQNAKVDNVTGATQTSDAFRISLDSALQKAI